MDVSSVEDGMIISSVEKTHRQVGSSCQNPAQNDDDVTTISDYRDSD